MKNTCMKIVFLIVSMGCVSLTGCSSTNTQGENTAIGAVGGAVVGGVAGGLIGNTGGAVVGVVAGGLLGGLIGHSMDSTDNTTIYSSMDNNPTNQSTTWKHDGNTYTVAPTSSRMAYGSYQHCRRYYATAYINGKKQKMSGIACRQPNGTWEAMSGS